MTLSRKMELTGIVALLLGALFLATSWRPAPVQGSVSRGSEYHATTTTQATTPVTSIIESGSSSCILGSIVVTGAATGNFVLYDATTSNVNLRTNQTATSSLSMLAWAPASMAAGTYTFDEACYNGILFVANGTIPTTTITYR